MGLFSRLLGLSEATPTTRGGRQVSAGPGLSSAGAGFAGEDRDDPLSLDAVETAMKGRETAQGRAAKQTVLAALDDEDGCRQLVGAVRRVMREEGNG